MVLREGMASRTRGDGSRPELFSDGSIAKLWFSACRGAHLMRHHETYLRDLHIPNLGPKPQLEHETHIQNLEVLIRFSRVAHRKLNKT